MDLLEGEAFKRFMLHYNFPPFSVGETNRCAAPAAGKSDMARSPNARCSAYCRTRKPSRIRSASCPTFWNPTVRQSMATVCGGTLALMDAGVPIKAPVAGVAMGLVKEGDNYAILTDIAGAEDHYGDMDFKVAGTRDGITALQMDIKIPGVTSTIMAEALEQASAGRLHILDKMMNDAMPAAREEMSPFAPRIYSMKIPTDKIRDVIGPGGKMIRSIIEQTGVKIDVSDDGRVNIASSRWSFRRNRRSRSFPNSRQPRKWARSIWARLSESPTSARLSRSSRAPTDCCTFRNRRTAHSQCSG